MKPITKIRSRQMQDFFQKRYSILKRRTAWICILLLSANFCLKADVPRAKGYYIDNDGNKFEVTILVATFLGKEKNVNIEHHQHGFTYLDNKGKKVIVKPHEAQEFGYTYKNEKYIFRYLPSQIQGSFLGIKQEGFFYYVALDGACQVYKSSSSYQGNNGSTGGTKTSYILLKSKEDLYYSHGGIMNNNKKSLEEFFADCPELVAKIKAKEFKKMDDKWIKIAEFYNKNCQSGGSVSEEAESE